jgi:hypothetical protein
MQTHAMQLRADAHRRQVESEKDKEEIKRKYREAMARQDAAARESSAAKRNKREENAVRDSIAVGLEPPPQWVSRHPLYTLPPPVPSASPAPPPLHDRALRFACRVQCSSRSCCPTWVLTLLLSQLIRLEAPVFSWWIRERRRQEARQTRCKVDVDSIASKVVTNRAL